MDLTADYGIHKGIVIDNYDREIPFSGRVQVFIPDIHSASLQALFKGQSSSQFRFMGDNITTSLTPDVIEYLKSFCPWATATSPIIGDVGVGMYDVASGKASVTENPCISLDPTRNPASNYTSLQGVINTAGGYQTPSQTFVRNADPNPFSRAPDLTNLPKGVFSVPRVGSTLLLQFYDGNINYPVYIAAVPDALQYRQVFLAANVNKADGQTSPVA
jgi:hypothetical protein